MARRFSLERARDRADHAMGDMHALVAFRPGSRLEIKNEPNTDKNNAHWHLGGFLVRP